jgi:hypothetical protein
LSPGDSAGSGWLARTSTPRAASAVQSPSFAAAAMAS